MGSYRICVPRVGFLMLGAMLSYSCLLQEEPQGSRPEQPKEEAYISFEGHSPQLTRGSFQFKEGDTIGVQGYYYNQNNHLFQVFENTPLILKDNQWVPHKWEEGKLVPDYQKWKADTKRYEFYAYYPYTSDYYTENNNSPIRTPKSRSFWVQRHSPGNRGIRVNMWDHKLTDDVLVTNRRIIRQDTYADGKHPPIQLDFNHLYSKVTLTISKSPTLKDKITPISMQIKQIWTHRKFGVVDYLFENNDSEQYGSLAAAYNHKGSSTANIHTCFGNHLHGTCDCKNQETQLSEFVKQKLDVLPESTSPAILDYFNETFLYPTGGHQLSLVFKYLKNDQEQHENQPFAVYDLGFQALPFEFNQVYRIHLVLGEDPDKPKTKSGESNLILSSHIEY